MNAMTEEDYKETYWPRLEKAVEQLLTQSPAEYTSLSYEQMYSHVYTCVCQQYSDHLYSDLIWKITSHLEQVCLELQDSRPESFVENFNLAFTQYMAAVQCIVPVFIYMNKFYIETKLKRNLKDDLMDLFSAHVAEKHISTLIPLLQKADAMPFQVKPSTMASVVKGLYALRPDWAQLAPPLFSRFIPQIHPPVLESDLLYYAAQDQKLQKELSLNGFSRCDQSRKRASEES
ncbi:CDK2-associated and cullin domain-containing protein 1 [Neoarius graeffei]|uniref:CDK2-associated and cullin domain-containing protein 1 n=1 Tax=Neoarius graeffei TaxID=443677 RepID=UPI00298C5F1B|nr:CDK2-associated and cullin domain-containing protein 1 [Neoarius graeffei]